MELLYLIAAEAFDSSLLSNIKFYVILALLAAALVAIIVIFAKWDAFKAKKNKDADKKDYIPPDIIKVEDNHNNTEV